jgi:hypothetical protein
MLTNQTIDQVLEVFRTLHRLKELRRYSKPIALPRPPQTRAAYFKRPYPKCPGSEILATTQRCRAGSLQIRF